MDGNRTLVRNHVEDLERYFRKYGYPMSKHYLKSCKREYLYDILDLMFINKTRADIANNDVNFGFNDRTDLSFSERIAYL